MSISKNEKLYHSIPVNDLLQLEVGSQPMIIFVVYFRQLMSKKN